jgi:hypothetical protein
MRHVQESTWLQQCVMNEIFFVRVLIEAWEIVNSE